MESASSPGREPSTLLLRSGRHGDPRLWTAGNRRVVPLQTRAVVPVHARALDIDDRGCGFNVRPRAVCVRVRPPRIGPISRARPPGTPSERRANDEGAPMFVVAMVVAVVAVMAVVAMM